MVGVRIQNDPGPSNSVHPIEKGMVLVVNRHTLFERAIVSK